MTGSVRVMAKPRMDVNLSFRLRHELRDAANRAAAERQEDLSDVLRARLEEYVREHEEGSR